MEGTRRCLGGNEYGEHKRDEYCMKKETMKVGLTLSIVPSDQLLLSRWHESHSHCLALGLVAHR